MLTPLMIAFGAYSRPAKNNVNIVYDTRRW
jgi:hypothetical protein